MDQLPILVVVIGTFLYFFYWYICQLIGVCTVRNKKSVDFSLNAECQECCTECCFLQRCVNPWAPPAVLQEEKGAIILLRQIVWVDCLPSEGQDPGFAIRKSHCGENGGNINVAYWKLWKKSRRPELLLDLCWCLCVGRPSAGRQKQTVAPLSTAMWSLFFLPGLVSVIILLVQHSNWFMKRCVNRCLLCYVLSGWGPADGGAARATEASEKSEGTGAG